MGVSVPVGAGADVAGPTGAPMGVSVPVGAGAGALIDVGVAVGVASAGRVGAGVLGVVGIGVSVMACIGATVGPSGGDCVEVAMGVGALVDTRVIVGDGPTSDSQVR